MRDPTPIKPAAPVGAAEAAARARAPAEPPALLIPDGCNLGTLLRVTVGVNVAALMLALAIAPEYQRFGAAFLSAAAVLEPVTLLTLLAWCGLRRLLAVRAAAVSPPMQRVLAWVVPAAVALPVPLIAFRSASGTRRTSKRRSVPIGPLRLVRGAPWSSSRRIMLSAARALPSASRG